MKYRFFYVLLFFLLSAISHAQFRSDGVVVDSITGKPLAFVNITSENGKFLAITDIEGLFYFNADIHVGVVIFSYLGYKSKAIPVSGQRTRWMVRLQPVPIELKGVQVFPEKNPAVVAIQKAIDNRHLNNPENIRMFRYKSYNKLLVDWYLDKTMKDVSEGKFLKPKEDSLFKQMKANSEKSHVLIMESVTERTQVDGKNQEIVSASKVSGFTNPQFTTLATDIQPFSFYQDFITLTLTDVKDYINPVSKGSIERYDFEMNDTILSGADSVFVISFTPKKGKNFNGLSGMLYINSNRYAIQNVIAQPAEEGLWNIKIQQMYEFSQNQYWFPKQLNYEWILPNYPSEKAGIVLRGTSFIDNVSFHFDFKNSDFEISELTYDKNAVNRGEDFWKKNRNDSLTSKEVNTYTKMDSLGKKKKFDYISLLAEKALKGYVPLSVFDVSLEHLFQYNNIEGIRVGWGMKTNEKVSRWFSVGGFAGYGFWDYNWKYGGNLNFVASHKKDISFDLSYEKDISTPGRTSFVGMVNYSYWNDYLMDRCDFSEKFSFLSKFRLFKYLQTEVGGSTENILPLYTYTYQDGNQIFDHKSHYQFTEIKTGFRFAFKEKIIDAFEQKILLGSKYPVLYLTFTHGFKNVLLSDFEFNKLEFALEKTFNFKYFGRTDLRFESGYAWGNLPYMKLFKGKGSYSSSFMLYFRNSFQTMRVDEFAYDKFVSLIVTHNFGNYLFRIKNFKPEFSIFQGFLYGNLSSKNVHYGIDFRVPEKVFFESGVLIDNIVRLKLLNLFYCKLGAGVFYRYGYYSYDNIWKNFALKLNIKISGSK